MRPRLTVLVVAAALLAVAFVPAAKASGGVEDPAITGTLTYLTFDTAHGTVRGVFANFNLLGFTADDIDDSTPGGIVVRLLDTSTPPRTRR